MLIEFGEKKEKNVGGNSLVVQWLGLCAVSAEGLGSIPSWETRIPQSEQHDWKKKNVVGKAIYWEQVSLHLVLIFPVAKCKKRDSRALATGKKTTIQLLRESRAFPSTLLSVEDLFRGH